MAAEVNGSASAVAATDAAVHAGPPRPPMPGAARFDFQPAFHIISQYLAQGSCALPSLCKDVFGGNQADLGIFFQRVFARTLIIHRYQQPFWDIFDGILTRVANKELLQEMEGDSNGLAARVAVADIVSASSSDPLIRKLPARSMDKSARKRIRLLTTTAAPPPPAAAPTEEEGLPIAAAAPPTPTGTSALKLRVQRIDSNGELLPLCEYKFDLALLLLSRTLQHERLKNSIASLALLPHTLVFALLSTRNATVRAWLLNNVIVPEKRQDQFVLQQLDQANLISTFHCEELLLLQMAQMGRRARPGAAAAPAPSPSPSPFAERWEQLQRELVKDTIRCETDSRLASGATSLTGELCRDLNSTRIIVMAWFYFSYRTADLSIPSLAPFYGLCIAMLHNQELAGNWGDWMKLCSPQLARILSTYHLAFERTRQICHEIWYFLKRQAAIMSGKPQPAPPVFESYFLPLLSEEIDIIADARTRGVLSDVTMQHHYQLREAYGSGRMIASQHLMEQLFRRTVQLESTVSAYNKTRDALGDDRFFCKWARGRTVTVAMLLTRLTLNLCLLAAQRVHDFVLGSTGKRLFKHSPAIALELDTWVRPSDVRHSLKVLHERYHQVVPFREYDHKQQQQQPRHTRDGEEEDEGEEPLDDLRQAGLVEYYMLVSDCNGKCFLLLSERLLEALHCFNVIESSGDRLCLKHVPLNPVMLRMITSRPESVFKSDKTQLSAALQRDLSFVSLWSAVQVLCKWLGLSAVAPGAQSKDSNPSGRHYHNYVLKADDPLFERAYRLNLPRLSLALKRMGLSFDENTEVPQVRRATDLFCEVLLMGATHYMPLSVCRQLDDFFMQMLRQNISVKRVWSLVEAARATGQQIVVLPAGFFDAESQGEGAQAWAEFDKLPAGTAPTEEWPVDNVYEWCAQAFSMLKTVVVDVAPLREYLNVRMKVHEQLVGPDAGTDDSYVMFDSSSGSTARVNLLVYEFALGCELAPQELRDAMLLGYTHDIGAASRLGHEVLACTHASYRRVHKETFGERNNAYGKKARSVAMDPDDHDGVAHRYRGLREAYALRDINLIAPALSVDNTKTAPPAYIAAGATAPEQVALKTVGVAPHHTYAYSLADPASLEASVALGEFLRAIEWRTYERRVGRGKKKKQQQQQQQPEEVEAEEERQVKFKDCPWPQNFSEFLTQPELYNADLAVHASSQDVVVERGAGKEPQEIRQTKVFYYESSFLVRLPMALAPSRPKGGALSKTAVTLPQSAEDDDQPQLPSVKVQTREERLDPDTYVPSQNEIMDVLWQYLPDFDYERVMRHANSSLEIGLEHEDYVKFQTDKHVAAQDRVYRQLLDLCTPHGLTPLLTDAEKAPFFKQYVSQARERIAQHQQQHKPSPPAPPEPVMGPPAPRPKRPRPSNEPSHWVNPVPQNLSTDDDAFWDVRNWMDAANQSAHAQRRMMLT